MFNIENLVDDVKLRKTQYMNSLYGCLSNVLGNIFSFGNMKSIDNIDLKRCFFYAHYVGYGKNLDGREVSVPLTPKGTQNFFNEYTTFTSAIPEMTKDEFSVFSKDNLVGFSQSFYNIPDSQICWMYADRMADILISCDNAVIASRILNVFFGSENEVRDNMTQFQLKNIGVPVMIKQDIAADKPARAERQEHPTIIKDYYDAFREILNEFMIITGLNSMYSPNKRERLLVDELKQTDNIKSSILSDKYQCRLNFIDLINERYGHDYFVEINVDESFLNQMGGV